MADSFRIGVVGGRGHTGSELLRILAGHPQAEVAYAGSRSLAGSPVPQIDGLEFGDLDPNGIAALELEAMFLALPNGVSQPFVEILGDETVAIDISADHRFDPAWAYGLPELQREKIAGARRVANPGCYATAAQLTLSPFLDLLDGVPAVFGVSGYSGAGTTPSPKNDPERLAENLMPYTLTGHIHERETSHHLGHPVRFMPHVHPAFRGLLVTSHIPVNRSLSQEEALEVVTSAYLDEPLIEVGTKIPELKDGTGLLGVLIGGVEVSEDGRNVVVVAAEDNLLKGAAVQAVQNLNLALGLEELAGIQP